MDLIRKKSFSVWDMSFQARTIYYQTYYDKNIAKYRITIKDGVYETMFVYPGESDICRIENDAKETFANDNYLFLTDISKEEENE
jgi:hypothetical protein